MTQENPIAVVGMAGLFPAASNLDIFWQNIINKVDATTEVLPERWSVPPDAMHSPAVRPDSAVSKRCCLIKDFSFDPSGIDIAAEYIKTLDPLHQIVLHVGRQALANLTEKSLNRRRTGVILAAIALPTEASSLITRRILGTFFEEKLYPANTGRQRYFRSPPLTRAQCLAARVTGLPAAIVARAFGLGGSSYTLDAACASSLYAVKLACDELHARRADTMLAGGVSRPDCLFTQVGFSQLRALSPTGRCAPFDKSADGLVVGEGAGMLVLKRLEDALRDQDRIHGLIRGIGLSNDMRGTLLAPDSEGQLRAMRTAYEAAGWSPRDVELVECHGAGTPVGDATELKSLTKLWGDSGWSPGQCALGSVKSMIGHLLTAAGAAGMIKTLLALQHEILPPSLNFTQAPPDSPLNGGPFRVQTEPEKWPPEKNGRPLRAAVSAFGFGGINAHLLLEQWRPGSQAVGHSANLTGSADAPMAVGLQSLTADQTHPKKAGRPAVAEPAFGEPVAIVGMEAVFGVFDSLRKFQEAIFNGRSNIRPVAPSRWRGARDIAADYFPEHLSGGFIEQLALTAGQFHIPPNEIPDILPQQLLMLKVAAAALADAGLSERRERPRMGAVIGIDFDFETTSFHLRWQLKNLVSFWRQKHNPDLNEKVAAAWLKSLQGECSPPLTAARTLGALGSVVASRIAREFRLGGPSFTVSCEAAAGLRALEIAVRSLQQRQTTAMLVGAVDLGGDLRSLVVRNQRTAFSQSSQIRPFDRSADGTLPGEGAAAVVLKPLDQARADGDRIYALVKGLGSAGGGAIEDGLPSADAYRQSLRRCCADAGIDSAQISLMECHGSGNPAADRMEAEALHAVFSDRQEPCALGSVMPAIGHTGAVAGLAALIKAGLCLYHELLAPLPGGTVPSGNIWQKHLFHIPVRPQFWVRNRRNGPRRAMAAVLTTDGDCLHVMLEGCDDLDAALRPPETLARVARERKKPLGFHRNGLFAIEGDDEHDLLAQLEILERHVLKYKASTAGRPAIEPAAAHWHQHRRLNPDTARAVCIVAADLAQLQALIGEAKNAVATKTARRITGATGLHYSPDPLGRRGELAFVFPGSGNHYLGMGRQIGVCWPQVLRDMDRRTPELKTQLRPECYVPWRSSWEPGWQQAAYKKIVANPLNMIFGQVVHGGLMADLMQYFCVRPGAVIGYSLGESTGFFAMGVWADRDEMLKRMQTTPLFATELAGPCNAARRAWHVPPTEAVDWCAAVVNRSADRVRKVIGAWPTTRLLIVNTPDECVIGGRRPQVNAAIEKLACEAIFLDGVVTVHCDALSPVKKAYRDLHLLATSVPENIRFYSCARARAFALTSENAADVIFEQALQGFDFTATVAQAYRDGIRVFLELGPSNSCTRMIDRILKGRDHLAVSADVRGESDDVTVIKVLAALIAERIPVDLDKLYAQEAYAPAMMATSGDSAGRTIQVAVGGPAPCPCPPPLQTLTRKATPKEKSPAPAADLSTASPLPAAAPGALLAEAAESLEHNMAATAEAHQRFLDFSGELAQNFAKTFELQTRLLALDVRHGQHTPVPVQPAYSRQMCLEFARGSAAAVLGPEFAVVDTYKARVRLPDEPLMLVDRIMTVEGRKGSLGPGRVITEHDVLPGAWYLDGGHAPVCIAVEAGQADLFLCAYLGIDLRVKGRRTYRLLDATVRFHRGLPHAGETIRYDIKIEKFVRQAETYLFFFSFEGTIAGRPLISMTDGCAGFFTPREVDQSGGIILGADEARPSRGRKPENWKELVPMSPASYDAAAMEALRAGDAARAFGPLFEGIVIADSLRLPDGRMKLIDRVVNLEPAGGRYGLGRIQAEADIHPDDWFLTCHFVDDRVMPGTLMYECCAHTLRVFLQRLGWVTDKPGACYEPVVGVASTLKCRGPVTPETCTVLYEVEIKEIGYAPKPYAIADAHMYADGQCIVYFKDMALQMSGITRDEIQSLWAGRSKATARKNISSPPAPLFDRRRLCEFATGKPSAAFGRAYEIFDHQRFIARLPAPPYLFIDRITRVGSRPWVLAPGGWSQAEYDVPADAWYFRAERSPFVPISIVLEIALQPCGWLAAYMGSALKSDNDLRFRNLGGSAMLHDEIGPTAGTLTTRIRLTRAAEAADMIIEHFDFEIRDRRQRRLYAGNTYFGFFTATALAQQEGIRDVPPHNNRLLESGAEKYKPLIFGPAAPLRPDDPTSDPAPSLTMPASAIRMVDGIDAFVPDGGPAGLGFVRGRKSVNADEWFFKAHFYQDPVCPGSLGIESFVQLIKFAALQRWPQRAHTHRFAPAAQQRHHWLYRGQILPTNKEVVVEAVITRIVETPRPEILADGYLKVDGLYIYKISNFGVKLVPL